MKTRFGQRAEYLGILGAEGHRTSSTEYARTRSPAHHGSHHPRVSEGLLTSDELARKLAVSVKTLRRWAAAEGLPLIRIGRLVRFDPGDVSRWLSARKE